LLQLVVLLTTANISGVIFLRKIWKENFQNNPLYPEHMWLPVTFRY
jgi:hypothetical protein